MCFVWSFDESDIFVAEDKVNGLHCIVEVLGIGGADDGGRSPSHGATDARQPMANRGCATPECQFFLNWCISYSYRACILCNVFFTNSIEDWVLHVED